MTALGPSITIARAASRLTSSSPLSNCGSQKSTVACRAAALRAASQGRMERAKTIAAIKAARKIVNTIKAHTSGGRGERTRAGWSDSLFGKIEV
jgi:hypothetical protein